MYVTAIEILPALPVGPAASDGFNSKPFFRRQEVFLLFSYFCCKNHLLLTVNVAYLVLA